MLGKTALFVVLATILDANASSILFAQAPRLDRISAAGAERGSTFQLSLSGERLGGINSALFYEDGLQFSRVVRADDYEPIVEFTASKDCRLGEHAVHIVSPQGVSELRTIHVGPYPIREESEPNSRVAEAERITLGSTITGLIDDGDIDVFEVELKEGESLSAEVVGARTGGFLFDPYLAVTDQYGKMLIENDDSTLFAQDSMLSFQARRAGKYYLHIREAAYGGDLDSTYILHIGPHQRPTVAYPAGGQRGQALSLTLLGDASGPSETEVSLPSAGSPNWSFYPPSRVGATPTPLPLRVSAFPNVMELEPNNELPTDIASRASENPGSEELPRPPFALNGRLQIPGDIDVFTFRCEAGERYRVETFAARIGSPLDTVVSIHDERGSLVTRNDDGSLHHDSALAFTAPQAGIYYLSVTDHLKRGLDTGVYRVEFQNPEPALTLRVPSLDTRQPQSGQAVQLARGNRSTLLVSALRSGFANDVLLNAGDLPTGVTVRSIPIARGSHLSYMLFEAAPDAPIGGNLCRIIGDASVSGKIVQGGLQQDVPLTLGPPRQTVYHSQTVDAIPLAVTEQAPVTLHVTPPRSPLVQDGQLNVELQLERHNGFDGPVTLRLPFLPPWFETPEEAVVIPAGVSAATYPLVVTNEAEARDWTLVIQGLVDIDGQSVSVSSQPFDVSVRAPLVALTVTPTIARHGQSETVRCKLDWKLRKTVPASATLEGLPKGVETQPVTFSTTTQDIAFPIHVSNETPAALHNTLYITLTVFDEAEPSIHYLGRGGVLEVVPEGGKARESASRLDILRQQRRNNSDTESDTETAGQSPLGVKP